MQALTAVRVPELLPAPLVSPGKVDERAARRSLLEQIGRLEAQLAVLFCSTYPRKGFHWIAEPTSMAP